MPRAQFIHWKHSPPVFDYYWKAICRYTLLQIIAKYDFPIRKWGYYVYEQIT